MAGEQTFEGEEVIVYDYGSFVIYTGTLSGICNQLKGNPHIKYTDFFYNGTDITAVEAR